ncbi:MAG: hypothetical protein MJK12_19460 [Colwellia sp.]|nr:hypothetical protein [Colwellia sp.]
MKKFNISRINTSEGIFKVRGHWHNHAQKVVFTQLEIMSTDGWQVLDLNHHRVIKLINVIEENVFQHLLLSMNSG